MANQAADSLLALFAQMQTVLVQAGAKTTL